MYRSILITGASGQLGTEVASHFVEKDWKVITVDKSPQRTETAERMYPYTCDLTSEVEVQQTFSRIFDAHGDVDAAVLLAGGFSMGDILETGTADLDRMISLNFKTAYHAAREAIRHFQQNSGGDLVFIGAKPALDVESSPGKLAYALSKSMVVRFAEMINAMHMKPAVRASVIAPSVIDTASNRDAMPDADFGDWVTPAAIAGAIDFILSPEGSNLRHTVFRMYNAS